MASIKDRKRLRQLVLWLKVLVALLLTAALVGWGFSLDWKVFKPATKAKTGVLEETVQGLGFCLRQESVVFSPLSGSVDQYVSEGVRVPTGKVVAVVTDEITRTALARERELLVRRQADLATRNPLNLGNVSKPGVTIEAQTVADMLNQVDLEYIQCQREIRASTAGIVSYFIDGLEETPLPVALKNLADLEYPLSSFPRLPREPVPTLRNWKIEKNQPLLKIVDNLQFWVVLDLPVDIRVEEGSWVQVRFVQEPNILIKARINKVVNKNDFTRLLLSIADYQDFFTTLRWVNLEVVLARYQGIILPNQALVKENGTNGVYVRGFGGVVFKPVTILGYVGDQVVVQGLAEGSKVIY